MHADTVLVRRAQAKDRAAFNEIVLRYKSKVYSFIHRMIPNPSDAEDLTQETFIKAYVSLKSFRGMASLNTWLYRIATNVCIDHNRRTGRLRGMVSSLTADGDGDDDRELNLTDGAFDPQRLALNSELGVRLDEALRALPEKLRTVVLLYDIEGLTYDEIVGVVNCPLGTVKSRLFNARAALRKELAPYLAGVAATQ